MPTFLTDITLSEPEGTGPVDANVRHYMASLSRHMAHELVLEAFERSGLSKADLAERLQCDRSRLSRILNTPSNLTVETLGELLFAIDGSSPSYSRHWPLREAARNYCQLEWLPHPAHATGSTTSSVVVARPVQLPDSAAKAEHTR